MSTYVMSDIHGNKRRFDEILNQINLTNEDKLYILGDVVDRFPDGITILQEIMKTPNMMMLLGNHEYMMLDYFKALDACSTGRAEKKVLEKDHYKRLWFSNGGEITCYAFTNLDKNAQDEIITYLSSLPVNIDVSVNGQNYLLVHGAPQKGCRDRWSEFKDTVEESVWTRIESYDAMPYKKTVIFGHTPTAYYQNDRPLEIWKGNRMIGIDCGCGYGEGRLACVRLDDMKVFYSA